MRFVPPAQQSSRLFRLDNHTFRAAIRKLHAKSLNCPLCRRQIRIAPKESFEGIAVAPRTPTNQSRNTSFSCRGRAEKAFQGSGLSATNPSLNNSTFPTSNPKTMSRSGARGRRGENDAPGGSNPPSPLPAWAHVQKIPVPRARRSSRRASTPANKAGADDIAARVAAKTGKRAFVPTREPPHRIERSPAAA